MFRFFLETGEPTKGNLVLPAFPKSKMRNQHKVADLLIEKKTFFSKRAFIVHSNRQVALNILLSK